MNVLRGAQYAAGFAGGNEVGELFQREAHARSGFGYDRDNIDFHQPFGLAEAGHHDPGRDRKNALQPFAANLVDRRATMKR